MLERLHGIGEVFALAECHAEFPPPRCPVGPEANYCLQLVNRPCVVGRVLEREAQLVVRLNADGVAVDGSNPGVQDLALMLAAAPDGNTDADLLQRAAAKFPTAAVAVLAFPGAWSRPGPGRA